jgi:hypothetical protein
MHRHQLAALTLRPRSPSRASPRSLRTQSFLPDLNAVWDSQADDDAESDEDLEQADGSDDWADAERDVDDGVELDGEDLDGEDLDGEDLDGGELDGEAADLDQDVDSDDWTDEDLDEGASFDDDP